MDIPLIHKFHGGYFAGAMYANPQLRADDVLVGQYIGQDPSAFNDPATAENIARNMYDRNAFVIYHAAGASGTGLFQAALDEDRWAIGVDSDQGAVFAESDSEQEQRIAEQILTSMLKRVDTSVFDIASDLIDDGEVNGGYRTYGLEDNGVAVAVNQYNEEILSPYLDRLEELQQMVVNGEIAVPDHDNQLEDWMAETF
jgi:basic membrane protein A